MKNIFNQSIHNSINSHDGQHDQTSDDMHHGTQHGGNSASNHHDCSHSHNHDHEHSSNHSYEHNYGHDQAYNHKQNHGHSRTNHDHHVNHNSHEHHDHTAHHEMMMKDFKKRFIVSFILTIPILILSPFIQTLLGYSVNFEGSVYVLFLLSSIVYFWGGFPFLKGFYDEIKSKRPGMMTLIAIAISVAYFYSTAVVFGLEGKYFFLELTTLIVVMLLGHYIEMRSVLGASKSLEKLAELMPDIAHLVTRNGVVDVKVTDLKSGDIVLVKVGEKFPADGIIVKGEGYVNESMLTGESKPIKKSKGDKVIGGAINTDEVLEVKITNVGENSYLSKVINLVKEAQLTKSKTENLANTAAKWLTVIAITSGIVTFFYWYLYAGDLAFSIERLVTVMVIACPHALGLAIPLVTAVSTSIAAKTGF